MRKKSIAYFIPAVLAVFFLLAFAGCAGPEPAPENDQAAEDVADGPDVFVAPKVETPPAVDGTPGDYPGTPLQVAGMEGYMAHDGETIYLYLQAEAGGWLSAGFNREGGGMDGANMIIGFFQDDGSAVVRNDLGQGQSHSEVADGILDGVFEEKDGAVVLECAYPLIFPDGPQFNLQALEPGNVYTLILAFHAQSQDPTQRHSRWGRLDFTLE